MIDLFAGLSRDLGEVEAIMAKTLSNDEPRVNDLIDDLGSFHGKMLRPTLLMLVAATLGEIRRDHHRLGASLEMIHTATLIHDDMIDEADTRRGQPTFHKRFGENIAVLLGDYFYTHAFSLVADMDSWVMQRLTSTTNLVCRGELHQMCARRDLELSETEYERIIHAKTAALCELAGEFGALSGTPAQRQAAARFGYCCGMAFQIVDDCLDFSGDPRKVGKTLATDIERGLMTLPVLRLLKRAEPRARAALGKRLLGASTPEAIAEVRREVLDGGGVDDALSAARDYIEQAKEQLERLPAGPERLRLAELADFIGSRDY